MRIGFEDAGIASAGILGGDMYPRGIGFEGYTGARAAMVSCDVAR